MDDEKTFFEEYLTLNKMNSKKNLHLSVKNKLEHYFILSPKNNDIIQLYNII